MTLGGIECRTTAVPCQRKKVSLTTEPFASPIPSSYFSYITQMTRNTKFVYKECSHAKETKTGL